jgi:hypothetical protein
MGIRPINDYSHISVSWFLGDEGDITDYSIGGAKVQDEFDPQKGRLYLEYIQLGYTCRQASLEVPMLDSLARKWQRGGRAAPPNFVTAYELARFQQAHAMADEVVDISDGTDRITGLLKEMERDSIDNPISGGVKHIIARHRKTDTLDRVANRMSSRKWYVSKIAPNNYGDKVQLEHQGGDRAVKIDHGKLTDEQLKKLVALDAEINDGK